MERRILQFIKSHLGLYSRQRVLLIGSRKFRWQYNKEKHNPDLGSDVSPVRNFSSRFSDVIDSVESRDVGSFLWLSIIIIDDIALQLTFSVNT